jgi:hypothetical protein
MDITSTGQTRRSLPGGSTDKFQPAYKIALKLAYTKARSELRLVSPLFVLFQELGVFNTPYVQFCFPAFAVDREHASHCTTTPSFPENDRGSSKAALLYPYNAFFSFLLNQIL